MSCLFETSGVQFRDVLVKRSTPNQKLGILISGGLVISYVQAGSPAMGRLQVGDTVFMVNGVDVGTQEEFCRAAFSANSINVKFRILPVDTLEPPEQNALPATGPPLPPPNLLAQRHVYLDKPTLLLESQHPHDKLETLFRKVLVPRPSKSHVLGITLSQNLIVRSVHSESPARGLLSTGDKVAGVNGIQVTDAVEFQRALQASASREVLFWVVPEGVSIGDKSSCKGPKFALTHQCDGDLLSPTFLANDKDETDEGNHDILKQTDISKTLHDCGTATGCTSFDKDADTTKKPIVSIQANHDSTIPPLSAIPHPAFTNKVKTDSSTPSFIATKGEQIDIEEKLHQPNTTNTMHDEAALTCNAAGYKREHHLEKPNWNQVDPNKANNEFGNGFSARCRQEFGPESSPCKGSIVLNCEDIGRNAARCPAFQSCGSSRISWLGVERALAYYEERDFEVHCICRQATAQKWPPPTSLDFKLVRSPEIDGSHCSDQLFARRLAQTYACPYVDNSNFYERDDRHGNAGTAFKFSGLEGARIAYMFDRLGCFVPL